MEVGKGSASTINHPQEEDWFDFNSATGASVERNPEVVVNDDSWAGFEGASVNATEPLTRPEVGNELNSATVDDFGIDDWADFKVAELPSTETVSALNTFSPNSVEPIMNHFEDPVVSGDVSNSAKVSESVAAEEIFEAFVQNHVDAISIEDNLPHRAELNTNTTNFDEIDVWAGLERTEPINQSSTGLLAESNIPINAQSEASTEQDRNDITVLSLPVKESLPEIELNDNLTATISKNSDACDFIDVPDSTSNIQMEQISLQPGNDFLNEPLGSFSTEVKEVANGTNPEALSTELLEGFALENFASDENVAFPTFAATENECLALNPVVDIKVFLDPTSENEPASEASSAEVHKDLKTVVEFPSDTSKNEIRDDTVATVPTELIEELPGIPVGGTVTEVAITPVDLTEAVESTATTTIEVSILEKPALTSELILLNQVEADNFIEDNFAAVNDVESVEAAPTFLEILPDSLVDSEIASELVEGKAAIKKPHDVHEVTGFEAEIATSVVEPNSLAPALTGLGEEQIVENKNSHDAVEPVAEQTNIIERGEAHIVENKDYDDVWTGLETTPASAAAAIAEPSISEITTTHLGDEKTNEKVEESNDDVWAGLDIASNSAATDGTSATTIVETVVVETNTMEPLEGKVDATKEDHNNNDDEWAGFEATPSSTVALLDEPMSSVSTTKLAEGNTDTKEEGNDDDGDDDDWTGFETASAFTSTVVVESVASETTTIVLAQSKNIEFGEENDDDDWAGFEAAPASANIVTNTTAHQVDVFESESSNVPSGLGAMAENNNDDDNDDWTGFEGGASSDAEITTAAPSTMSGTDPIIAPTQPQVAATVPPATLTVSIRDKDALTSGEQSLLSLLEKLSATEKTLSSLPEANADTSNDTKLLSTVSHWQHFSSLLFPSCPVALSSSVSESSTAADEMPVISVPARLRCDTGFSAAMNNTASYKTEVQSGVLLCRSSLQQLQEQRGLISANGDVLDMKALDAQLERLHLLPHQLRNQSATPVSSSAAASSAVTANAATGLTSYISDTNLVRCGSGWQRKIARLSAKSMSMSISHDAHDSDLGLLNNQVSLASLSQTDLQPPKPPPNSAAQLHAGDGPSASHAKGSAEEQRNHGSNLWTSGTGESDENNNNDDDWGGFVDSSPATPALTVSSGSHSVSAPSASTPKASTATSHVVGMGIADPFASSGTAAASSPLPPPAATTAKASATATVPAEDAAGLSNAARAVLLKLPDLSYILAST